MFFKVFIEQHISYKIRGVCFCVKSKKGVKVEFEVKWLVRIGKEKPKRR